jgi:hypothetical protein
VLLVIESFLVFYAANDIAEADVTNVFLPGDRTLTYIHHNGETWLELVTS